MPKSDKPPSSAPPAPSFEEAYGQLESLVREMESDDMPLSDLIDAYEQGIRLHALCQKRLEEAQGRIEIVRRRASGEMVTEPFDGTAAVTSTPAAQSPAAPLSLRQDAELF